MEASRSALALSSHNHESGVKEAAFTCVSPNSGRMLKAVSEAERTTSRVFPPSRACQGVYVFAIFSLQQARRSGRIRPFVMSKLAATNLNPLKCGPRWPAFGGYRCGL